MSRIRSWSVAAATWRRRAPATASPFAQRRGWRIGILAVKCGWRRYKGHGVISRRAVFSLALERPPRLGGALIRVHRTAMACRVEVAMAERDAGHVTAARA